MNLYTPTQRTLTNMTHSDTHTQIQKWAFIFLNLLSLGKQRFKKSQTEGNYGTKECRHGQLTILDQSLPRPSCLCSPAMVKIHGSHGKCRRERDLYMNRECWCKFINMHQHCWGCCGQYNKILHPEVIYQCSLNQSSRFLLVLIFTSRHKVGGTLLSIPIKGCCCPEAIAQHMEDIDKGEAWEGTNLFADYRLHPMCKRLAQCHFYMI